MALEGGMKCVKFIVIVLNLIFVAVGIALMTIGALVATRFQSYIEVMGPSYSGTPIVIAVAGVVIFLIAFFGCCGSFKESYCMISTYAFLLILALILQIGGGIAAFVLRGKVEVAVQKALSDSLKNYNSSTSYKSFIDSVQKDLKCCGSYNYTDWKQVFPSGKLPGSCCHTRAAVCNGNDKEDVNQEGCVDKLRVYMKHNIGIVAGIALAVCFIQILGIVLACCISKSLKEYEYV